MFRDIHYSEVAGLYDVTVGIIKQGVLVTATCRTGIMIMMMLVVYCLFVCLFLVVLYVCIFVCGSAIR